MAIVAALIKRMNVPINGRGSVGTVTLFTKFSVTARFINIFDNLLCPAK